MARDPELPRFAGPSALRLEDGQSCSGPPVTAERTLLALQDPPKKVLHFVCELRESSNPRLSLGASAVVTGSPGSSGQARGQAEPGDDK